MSVYTKFEVIWTIKKKVMDQRSYGTNLYYIIWEYGLVCILLPTNIDYVVDPIVQRQETIGSTA